MMTIKKKKSDMLGVWLRVRYNNNKGPFKEPRVISRPGVRFSINDTFRGPKGHRKHNRSRGSTGRLDGVSSPPSKSTTQGKKGQLRSFKEPRAICGPGVTVSIEDAIRGHRNINIS